MKITVQEKVGGAALVILAALWVYLLAAYTPSLECGYVYRGKLHDNIICTRDGIPIPDEQYMRNNQ